MTARATDVLEDRTRSSVYYLKIIYHIRDRIVVVVHRNRSAATTGFDVLLKFHPSLVRVPSSIVHSSCGRFTDGWVLHCLIDGEFFA